MNTLLQMPILARVYIVFVAMLGAVAAIYGVGHSGIHFSAQFIVYLLVAVLASALKVNLPTITGTMSVNSLFILISIVQLKQGEAMVIAVLGVMIQCLWRPKSRVVPVRVVFSAAANALAVSASYLVFDSPILAHGLDGVRVIATACTYFAVNTALVAVVVSITERKPVLKVWTECYFWCFPYYMGGAALALFSTFLNHRFDWQVSFVLLPVVYFLYRSYKLYLQRLEDEKKHVEEMAGLHLRTIEALALAIEAKDHTTHDHLRRVRVYALELGARMGLSTLDLQSLRAAALLHDIGKLAVPEYIISKPGKLTPEEFEKMKIHPVVGAQILDQVKFPYPVSPIVLSHHEKWDGSGYPNGLRGEEIPLGARILSAVDCLDALASDRQYRRALPLDKAMEIVAGEAGKSFDPGVVSLLGECYAELEQRALAEPHTWARLDTEMVISRGAAPATGFEQNLGLPEADLSAVEQSVIEPVLAAACAREAAQELYEWSQSQGGALQMSAPKLSEMLAVYAVRIQDLIPYDAIVFYLKQGTHLIPEYVGGQDRALFSALQIPFGEGLSGWVAENCKPVLNGNPSVEAGYLNDPSKFSTLCSALAVPLLSPSGTVGVLALYRRERDAFSATDMRTVAATSSRLAMALEVAQKHGSAGGRSPVTQLPGVRSLYLKLQQEIDRCAQSEGSFTLVLFDLDRFADVNRKHGYHTGDRVIQSLAIALSDVFPSPVSVNHLGGDEFSLLFADTTPEQMVGRLENLRFAVGIAAKQKAELLILSYSTGLVEHTGGYTDPDSLLAEAEDRMNRAKLAKRAAFQSAHQPPVMSLDAAGRRNASIQAAS